MNPFDENRIEDPLERQINRCLDGELGHDERLELDRELIRRPELREMLEQSERIDAIAAGALHSLLDDKARPRLTLPGSRSETAPTSYGNRTSRSETAPTYRRAWWLMPAAAAAAVLVLFFSVRRSDQGVYVADAPPAQSPLHPPIRSFDRSPTQMPVSLTPTRINRHVGRDLYGVVGTDGNIYLIETDHTRTVEQPGGQAQPRLAGNDL